ncbi:glutathione S-transferase family protein [Kalamiella sp. sgz302252]|uniref:glutathione S-transferase family protein n=1 Tax=Pantoea sp. sgz302252 TaxID=3341827 RepID=UPI0036D40F4C
MKVYTFPKSRSLRVLWTLEELKLDYETCPVDLFSPEPAVSSPHPLRKVPVLEDKGHLIFETAAICQYLCEKQEAGVFYPREPLARAKVNEWLSFSLTDLESPVWTLLKHKFLLPEALRSPAVVETAFADAAKALNAVRLGSPWIAGEHFTLADIFLAHTLMWAQLCGLVLNEALSGYVASCQQRSPYAAALERNNKSA